VEFKDGSPAQEHMLENRAAFTIGRSNSDLTLSDPSCSRSHAVILQLGEAKIQIRDLQSRNGTFLNGKRISESPISEGDEIHIGDCIIRIMEIELESQSWTQATEEGGNAKINPPPLVEKVVVLNSWPDQYRAGKEAELEKFVDQFSEDQIKKSARLRAIVKKRSTK